MDMRRLLDSMQIGLPENQKRQVSYDEQLTAFTITDTPENIEKFKSIHADQDILQDMVLEQGE